MDQNMSLHFMVARAEHELMVARAEQPWRQMEIERTSTTGGLVARLAAAARRVASARPGRAQRPATAASRQGSPSAC
jgi:hypothetical protein